MAYRKAAVYFIQCEGDQHIKIGRSAFPPDRHKSLQTAHATRLIVLGLQPNIYSERSVHVRFAHAHVRGEWYRPVPELLEYIRTNTKLPAEYYKEMWDLQGCMKKYPGFFGIDEVTLSSISA